eukprot:gene28288-37334_t
MSFFLKDENDGEILFSQNFTENDVNVSGYQTSNYNADLSFGSSQTTQWAIEDNKTAVALYSNQHNIVYTNATKGQIKIDELKMKLFMIQLSKNTFFKLSNNAGGGLKHFAGALGAGVPVVFSTVDLSIDFEIQRCINQIIYCPYGDELKPMFLHSKVMELLVLQAESYKRSQQTKTRVIKTEYDYERIIFARDYLLKNIEVPPSLAELSHIAGINEFKLKKGFRETFNQSVFQYLSNHRLETAKIHLLEGSKSPTELAFELGYSSLQHFSTAFKKKFGMPPKQVRPYYYARTCFGGIPKFFLKAVL